MEWRIVLVSALVHLCGNHVIDIQPKGFQGCAKIGDKTDGIVVLLIQTDPTAWNTMPRKTVDPLAHQHRFAVTGRSNNAGQSRIRNRWVKRRDETFANQ